MSTQVERGLIDMVDERIRHYLRDLPRTSYGTVDAVDAGTGTCSVFLSGDTVASEGFVYEPDRVPAVGDRVRVVVDSRGGDRYVDGIYGS